MANTVLIVDDEPRITLALMTRLEANGYQVFHAINGLAGVEAAALHQPDAIVLDVRMPDIDGFDTCRRIKRMPQLSDTPIVFLSANPQDEARRQAMEVGGSLFIAKPYEASEILKAIASLIESGTPREEGAANA